MLLLLLLLLLSLATPAVGSVTRDRVVQWMDRRRARWIADAHKTLAALDAEARRGQWHARDAAPPRQFCFSVLSTKRSAPMTSMLVASLLRSSARADLLANCTLTIVDCARDVRERADLRAVAAVAPFVRVVQAAHRAPAPRSPDARVRTQFYDYMQALQLCAAEQAAHTVVFEDDAFVAHDFLGTLRRVAVPHLRHTRSAWLSLWTHDYTLGRAVPPELIAQPRAPCYFADRAAARLATRAAYGVETRHTGYGNVARMFDRRGTRAAIDFMRVRLADYANGSAWLPIDHTITNEFGAGLWRGSIAPSLVQHVGFSVDQHMSSFYARRQPPVGNGTREWGPRSQWDAAFVERPYTRQQPAQAPRGFVGCYADAPRRRRMRTFLAADGPLSVGVCRARCADLEYPFAAIEFGAECFCSHTIDFARDPQPAGCRAPCERGGDICGGADELAVYRTAVCQ